MGALVGISKTETVAFNNREPIKIWIFNYLNPKIFQACFLPSAVFIVECFTL